MRETPFSGCRQTGWKMIQGQFLVKILLIFYALFNASVFASEAAAKCRLYFDDADYASAKPFCQHAAEQNNAEAQTLLGEMYDRGHALQADPQLAAKWWKLAAKQSYTPAQNLLALKYYYGGDVFGRQPGWPQDYTLAREIWQQSAFTGVATSQFMMGEFYLRGEGVERDYAEAYAWFMLALEGGYKLATDSLMEISRVISSTQKAHGFRRMDELKKRIKSSVQADPE